MASELLSAIEVRTAKPGDKPRKLRDGNGLNLLVHPNGSKYFQLRYTLTPTAGECCHDDAGHAVDGQASEGSRNARA